MESIALSSHNNNKENVFPFSQKYNNPILLSAQSSKKIVKKRRLERKSLADITHLFNYSAQSSSSFSNLPFPIHVSDSSRTRKGLVGVSDPAKVSSSKSLRMGFR